jgi:hypothetical protein
METVHVGRKDESYDASDARVATLKERHAEVYLVALENDVATLKEQNAAIASSLERAEARIAALESRLPPVEEAKADREHTHRWLKMYANASGPKYTCRAGDLLLAPLEVADNLMRAGAADHFAWPDESGARLVNEQRQLGVRIASYDDKEPTGPAEVLPRNRPGAQD